MRTSDRRKYPRLSQSFKVQLRKEGQDRSLPGTSIDMSQGGAFIKTRNWQSFKVRDHAVVARIDKKYKGIGVKFTKKLKQFEPIYVH